MSRLKMAEKPTKENIQGVDMYLVKINNNGWKADHASLGRIQAGGASASPAHLYNGSADK